MYLPMAHWETREAGAGDASLLRGSAAMTLI